MYVVCMAELHNVIEVEVHRRSRSVLTSRTEREMLNHWYFFKFSVCYRPIRSKWKKHNQVFEYIFQAKFTKVLRFQRLCIRINR